HLVHSPDPTLRSYLIERLAPSNVEPRALKSRLDEEKDVTARRALVLALGGFPRDRSPELIPVMLALYEHDPDAGMHGAAGWVLRRWDEADRLAAIDARYATGRPEPGRGWFVNKQGQTFSVIPGDQLAVLGAK